MDKLNFKDRSTWCVDNAARIADEFHYVPDANFMNALDRMITMAHEASVVELLGSVAQGLFTSWKPPLEHVPSALHSSQPEPTSSPVPVVTKRGCLFSFLPRHK